MQPGRRVRGAACEVTDPTVEGVQPHISETPGASKPGDLVRNRTTNHGQDYVNRLMEAIVRDLTSTAAETGRATRFEALLCRR
jgi:hypothetical protein